MHEGFGDIENFEEDEDHESDEGLGKAAAGAWEKETNSRVEQHKPGNPGWCAPPAWTTPLETGDTRVIQQTSATSHDDILEMTDKTELTVNVPWGTANVRTPENVRVNWSNGQVEVTLPDGTRFNPQGDFTVMVNGRKVMTVSSRDGQTSISRPNGHVVTFDRQGLVGVSSQDGGVIQHVNLRAAGKVKQGEAIKAR